MRMRRCKDDEQAERVIIERKVKLKDLLWDGIPDESGFGAFGGLNVELSLP